MAQYRLIYDHEECPDCAGRAFSVLIEPDEPALFTCLLCSFEHTYRQGIKSQHDRIPSDSLPY